MKSPRYAACLFLTNKQEKTRDRVRESFIILRRLRRRWMSKVVRPSCKHRVHFKMCFICVCVYMCLWIFVHRATQNIFTSFLPLGVTSLLKAQNIQEAMKDGQKATTPFRWSPPLILPDTTKLFWKSRNIEYYQMYSFLSHSLITWNCIKHNDKTCVR